MQLHPLDVVKTQFLVFCAIHAEAMHHAFPPARVAHAAQAARAAEGLRVRSHDPRAAEGLPDPAIHAAGAPAELQADVWVVV